MKAIGTITACFPYVDEETRVILQSVMDDVKNYNDFAEKLCERALNESLPKLAVYFAYYHCYNQGKYNFLWRLIDANIETELTRFFYLVAAQRRGEDIKWEEYQKAMFSALKQVKNDWMACHVYIAWRGMVEAFDLPETSVDHETLDILTSKIENDEEYGFFLSRIHRITARKLTREGNLKEAIRYYDKAISQAKKYDDQEALCILLQLKANRVKQYNFNEALSLLKIVKRIVDELGYIDGEGLYLHQLGHIAMAKGEFEKAIEYQNQCVAHRLQVGLPVGFMKGGIAFIYNQKGDGETALAMIDEGRTDQVIESLWLCQIQEAWAYLLIDKIDEASHRLEIARTSSLKSGDETNLAFTHFLEGLLTKRQGDLPTAIFFLKQALEIFERSQGLAYLHFTLVEMTDIEIEMTTSKKDSASLEVSGPMMRRLLEHVEERDLPGVAAQTKILLAKLRFKQGRFEESKELVDEVLELSEKTGMHYLRDMAERLTPDLLLS